MAKFGEYVLIFLLALTLIFMGLFWLAWNGRLIQVPSNKELSTYKLFEASEVYSADSVLLGKIYLENRKIITYDDLPDSLINCLLATEDVRFFEHQGIDFWGLLRVGLKTILFKEKTGGGSTISQQLVKNWYPRKSFENTHLIIHKIREWFAALKLEKLYTKNEILVLYFNTVPFGNNTFGIYAASKYYFDKLPAELQVHEMATLVGLLKGTTIYDPKRNPENCLIRRNLVLKNMLAHGFLSKEDYQIVSNKELTLSDYLKREKPLAPYFMQHIEANVNEIINANNTNTAVNLYTDGLRIYTTLHSRVQKHAENALISHLNALQEQFDAEWNDEKWQKNQSILLQLLKQKKYPGYKNIVETLSLNNTLSPEQEAVVNKMKEDLSRLHAGFTCIKNTGEVLAWVGGSDFKVSQYDHVKSSRQVGSVFKPIVYVTAVDQGVNVCNYFKNAKTSYSQFNDWEPKNASNNYQGEYTMKGALTYSLNVVSVQVLFRAGLLDVMNLAQQMGITKRIPEVPSISLGTPDISLFEMVNAYTCFANDGKRVNTKYLQQIALPNGKIIYQDKPEEVKEIFSVNVAATMTHMMESVVNAGTSSAIRSKYKLRGSIAGKTGTSQNQSDGWFIGYTPQFTAGAWVGAENPAVHFESINTGSGSKTALPIWANFAVNLQSDPYCAHLLAGDFTQPSKKYLACLNQPLYREREK